MREAKIRSLRGYRRPRYKSGKPAIASPNHLQQQFEVSRPEVINDARSRLRFVNEQLAYQADHDSAKAYLNKAHAKYIPNTEAEVNEQEQSG